MHRLPDAFVDRMVEVLGSRARLDTLLEVDERRAMRVNRLKTTERELVRRLEALDLSLERVPYAEDAFFVEDPHAEERSIGHVFEHQAGLVFLQAPVSTLPVNALDPQPGERVLDIAAAPGSKTTHIAERMEDRGLLVANDVHRGRVNNLISNLDQTGATNTVVTRADGCRLVWPVTFDKVLVDAPCSTLGSMHADWTPIERFSDGLVRGLAGKQRSLLTSAFHAVRPGGRIVYSTCTLEPRENEAIVDWFLDTYPVGVDTLELGIGHPGQATVAGETYRGDVEAAVRVFADEAASESFFVASFTKQADATFEDPRERDWIRGQIEPGPEHAIEDLVEHYGLGDPLVDEMQATQTASRWYGYTGPDVDEAISLGPDRAGLYVARPEAQGPRLSFEAATLVGRDAERTIDLAPDQARRWLAGEEVELGMGHDVPDAFAVVTCRGEPLGCTRPFGTRLPSYVPKRNRVPAEGELCGFLAVEGE